MLHRLSFCLFEDVTDYRELRRVKNQKFSFDMTLRFFLHNNIRQAQFTAQS